MCHRLESTSLKIWPKVSFTIAVTCNCSGESEWFMAKLLWLGRKFAMFDLQSLAFVTGFMETIPNRTLEVMR